MSEYSREELAALRNDEVRCIRILAACRRFVVNLGGAAGNYATFGQNEEVLLYSFHEVLEAHTEPGGEYEQLFAQRCQRAGLTPADVKLLQERWTVAQESEDADDGFGKE